MKRLILFFRAYQPGLFDAPVTVSGHTTQRGKYVAPYHSTRKKRLSSEPGQGDLFSEPAAGAETTAKPVTPAAADVEAQKKRILQDVRGKIPMSQKRAQSGGEYGPNGEWYPGGAFIATTDLPKRMKRDLQFHANFKVQTRNGWMVPEPGKMSILNKLGGKGMDSRTGEVNQEYMDYLEKEYGASPDTRKMYQEIADRYMAGEEWISVNDYPSLANLDDVARLYAAGWPVPGAVLDKLPAEYRDQLKKWEPPKGDLLAETEKRAPEPAKAEPPPARKPGVLSDDERVALQGLYDKRKALRQAWDDARMLGEDKAQAALTALQAANAEVEAMETATDWPKPSTASGLRQRYGIPDHWEIQDTYTGGNARPRTAAVGDYRVEFSWTGGQEVGQVQKLDFKGLSSFFVPIGKPKPGAEAVAWVQKQPEVVALSKPKPEPETQDLRALVEQLGGRERVFRALLDPKTQKITSPRATQFVKDLEKQTGVPFPKVLQYLAGEWEPETAEAPAAEDKPEPKEGDTKVENGIEYRLQGGRWHRVTPEPEPESKPVPEPDRLAALRKKVEELGGKKKVAQQFEAARKNVNLRKRGEEAIRALADATGTSVDDVMAELGLKPLPQAAPAPKPKAEQSSLLPPTGELSDDPSSPNYRYRDTGYVAGSRKELAAQEIRKAGQEGRRLRENDIDWEAVEQNPRQAKELITKSNLFGSVDWAALKADGLDSGAGFLIDRVYASVGTEPVEDTPEARRLYSLGLETLRDRLEKCRTTPEVLAAVKDIRDEHDGVMLTAEQTAELEPLIERMWAANKTAKQASKGYDELVSNYSQLSIALGYAKRQFQDWEQHLKQKGRLGRKEERAWRQAYQDIQTLQPQVDAAKAIMDQYAKDHPEAIERKVDLGKGWSRRSSPLMDEFYKLREQQEQKVAEFREANQAANPLLRTWQQLGDRFNGVLHYNSHKGSKAFGDHVYRAQHNQIDWSWAEKFEQGQAADVKSVTKREKQFRLHVADRHERTGGREVQSHSTEALKTAFQLREVQSGNWVLEDPDSAKFHVEQAAGALADLADLTGIPDHLLALNGRLALAFGARGRGSSTGIAHYEPVERVINLTKMSGGGSLGHEWLHAVDNILGEMATGHLVGIKSFLSENAETSLPAGDLRDAFVGLREAMWWGTAKAKHEIAYTAADVKTARYNIDRDHPAEAAKLIRAAPNALAAVAAVEDFYRARTGRQADKNRKDWIRMAVAYHDGQEGGGSVMVPMGTGMSDFGAQAIDIDQGKTGKYWSQTREMAARAFSAWCQDRLSDQGRRNTYLCHDTDNMDYRTEGARPYPEGEERQRINAAFDRIFQAIRDYGVMAKALAFLAQTWEDAA